MANDLDAMEDRMRKIRTGWQGESPAPGTPEFGERARARRDALRESALAGKPVSVDATVKRGKFRTEEHEDILKKADE